MLNKRPYFAFLFVLFFVFLSPTFVAESLQTPTELFFSEYIEGSSNNKSLELYNGTGSTINLAAGNYTISMYFNGATTANTVIDLTGTVASGDVYVLSDEDANSAIQAETDQTNGSSFFNGNDTVVLTKNGEIIDAIGELGASPGDEWGDGLTSTKDNTLRRKSSVCAGDSNQADSFDPALEWDGFSSNNADDLGSHTVNCGGDVTPPPLSCDTPVALTEIYAIQGSGMTSPLVGNSVTIEGVVTGDFQTNGNTDQGDLGGFYVQGTADNDASTSDAIFVLANTPDVAAGDLVQVAGTVTEFETSSGASSMTEITGVTAVNICANDEPLPTAVNVTFPLGTVEDMEAFEGMLVTFPQPLVISEYFNYNRFGEMVLTKPIDGLERPLQPTAYVAPGNAAIAVENELALNRISLDDGLSTQNPTNLRHPNGNLFGPANLFRGGDTVQNVIGVVDDTFGRYRIQPTGAAVYTATNPRQLMPADVGGNLKAVSLNVQNYFLTTDEFGSICGANQGQGCRGADTANELERQRAKLIAALLTIDADIYGIVEIENTPGVEPLADLVNGLNDTVGSNTFAYVDTGVIGGDAIRVGFIYKATAVTPVGEFKILDSSVDPTYVDTKNRPALAQTFEQMGTGERLTVAVNHFKSKGSNCNALGDPDLGDGQANCNLTRTAAAVALANWLASDPTGSDDPDVLILGDLNAYDKEDPIQALLNAGYVDLARLFNGEAAYSFVFDGKSGYLDYALANESLRNQITDVTEWHINSDEPDVWDYDTTFTDPSFYEENAFRVSDHDPIIVGIGLNDALSNADNVIYLPIISNGQ